MKRALELFERFVGIGRAFQFLFCAVISVSVSVGAVHIKFEQHGAMITQNAKILDKIQASFDKVESQLRRDIAEGAADHAKNAGTLFNHDRRIAVLESTQAQTLEVLKEMRDDLRYLTRNQP
jgi:hypothetical protein